MTKNSSNWLSNIQFSIDEIMPLLEEKISSIMRREYKIDFFITNQGSSNCRLDVQYFAFPKEETSYIKMFFIHDGYIYTYSIEDDKHAILKKVAMSSYNIKEIDIRNKLHAQHSDLILIGQETINVEDALKYLLLPHTPQYHLFNNFFCYNESIDEISDTIESFSKQKVSTNR